ncbi:MAG: hypothetical protein ACRCXT_16900 [Paraclostridium sp.]
MTSFCVGCKNVDNSPNVIKSKESILIFRINEDSWDKDSKNPILKITDEEGIELFENLIDNATKVDGLLDMAPPSYIAEITSSKNYEGYIGAKTETIIFELDAFGGLYCKNEDTHTWYTFNLNDVSNFAKYLDKINKKI